MRTFDQVTLLCIDTKQPIEALLAMMQSKKSIGFAACKFLTDKEKLEQVPNFVSGIDIIDIGKINNLARYNEFCLKEFVEYFDTEFCLMVQHDGFVVRPHLWSNKFFEYDYIGAPWPEEWGYCNRVGNGGFSLRSKKFAQKCKDIFNHIDFHSEVTRDRNDISINEDFLSCVIHFEEMKSNGIKFAPPELAALFSTEHYVKEMLPESFGFHDKFTDFTKEAILEKYINLTL